MQDIWAPQEISLSTGPALSFGPVMAGLDQCQSLALEGLAVTGLGIPVLSQRAFRLRITGCVIRRMPAGPLHQFGLDSCPPSPPQDLSELHKLFSIQL